MIKMCGKNVLDIITNKITDNIKKVDYIPILRIICDNENYEEYKYYLKSIQKVCDKFNIKTEIIDIKNITDDLLYDSYPEYMYSYLIMKPISPKYENKVKEITDIIEWYADPDIITERNTFALYNAKITYESILPATVESIREIIKYYFSSLIAIKNKTVLIVGRSKTIGKPAAALFDSYDFTVTVANSKTSNKYLNEIAKNAGIIVLCSGKSGLIKRESLNKDQIIIDCGFSPNGGDLGYLLEENEVFAYTPVPGGIGVLTPYELINNMLRLRIESQER